ncbi:nucleotidyltransferase family protein [Polaribacter litorisediminis]|uniref:nucleotidyltransferase domain-containing protein n=1 Tax=Polaribacter litorisediminis TaxID=1908341 RepID=UPI001CC0CD9B|nr:nucleotidyltransferase family protein [Polaribacter litorisediminis]UAM98460.1 nucleotidyltransferase family protein [Polaribacter litorisediminis]
MTYKETLFFIGKCLTINHEKHNRIIVEKDLKAGHIDWDTVVKVSTSHFIFPTLYCNLKKADFLDYLPQDLVDYMKRITDLNRHRNQQIISEAKEINTLLLAHNSTPIFLKGTGNLLEGLYEDIGERMVGDIDFIVSKNEYEKAIKIIQNNGYFTNYKTDYVHPQFKHYPRMRHKNYLSAIEIHKELLIEKYADEFNYNSIKKDYQTINGISFLSFKNQLCLSVFASQINDHGFLYKNISLRNAYDVFLLSKKTTTKNAFDDFKKLKKPLNCFLASCHILFNEPKSIEFNDNLETKKYLEIFNMFLENNSLRIQHQKKIKRRLRTKGILNLIFKYIFNPEHRTWFFTRISDKDFYIKKLIQLGLKKPTPNA